MSGAERIDKWLWHARLVRTRSLAAGLVSGGHVRLNRNKISKPSQPVKLGDVITVALPTRIAVLRVEATAVRRGPASEARLLYCDLSPPPTERTIQVGARTPGTGRPTKRDRRRIEVWKDDPDIPDEEEI